MTASERVARAAQDCVGVRFRLHGRDPVTGLDCVGLAAVAAAAGRPLPPVPSGYALCGGRIDDILAWARRAGLRRVPGAKRAPGTLLLCAPGPLQHHLAVSTGGGIVHADLALRRVVERPGAVPWPVLAAWCIHEGEG